MNNNEEKVSLTKKRLRLKLKSIWTILLIIPLSIAIGYIFISITANIKFSRLLREASTSDISKTILGNDIKDLSDISNGANLVQEGIELYIKNKELYKSQMTIEDYGTVYNNSIRLDDLKSSKEYHEKIKTWISVNKEASDKIKEGLAYPIVKCKYDVNQLKSRTMQYFTFCKFIQLTIYDAILENDKKLVLDSFRFLVDFSCIDKNEDLEDFDANSYFIVEPVVESLKIIADNVSLNEDDVKMINHQLDRLLPYIDASRYYNNKCHFLLEISERIFEGKTLCYEEFYYTYPLIKFDVVQSIELYSYLSEISKESFYKIKDKIRKIEIYFENVRNVRYKDHFWILNPIENIYKSAKAMALFRIVKSKLAAKIFELRYNRKPTSLEELINNELIKEDAIDPITGKMLQFEIINDNVVIHSLGFNYSDYSRFINYLDTWNGIYWKGDID